MKKIFILTIVLFVLNVAGQEQLNFLESNILLYNYNKKTDLNLRNSTTLELPLVIDFSNDSIYPSNNYWENQYVFINKDMAVNPPSIGVATFDGLNEFGLPYDNSSNDTYGIADILTSHPINLDYDVSDSLYFSFFYQSAGLGNLPEEEDSLLLEFSLPLGENPNFTVEGLILDSVHLKSDTVFNYNYQPINDLRPPIYGFIASPSSIIEVLLYNDSNNPENPTDTLNFWLAQSEYDSLGIISIIDLAPDTSLFLQYSNSWVGVWSTPGFATENFNQIMIPLIDSNYLYNGFQFRFKNYATLSGNLDHWHVDYIRVGMQRTLQDTIIPDIAITRRASSILKDYYSMPWTHYVNTTLQQEADSVTVYWRNNDDIMKNVLYEYEVLVDNNIVYSILPTGDNFTSYSNHSFIRPFNFNIPGNTLDSNLVRVKHSISTSDFDFEGNNEVEHFQKFYNYYSYDDETAERAYGLNVSGGKVAMKFTPAISDTIRGARIHFNPLLNTEIVKSFKLAIWDATGTDESPGNLIYKMDSLLYVNYTDDILPFSTCLFDTAIYVGNTFYIGVEQTFDSELHIGYDINSNHSEKLYYNVDGSWLSSIYEGSLMINPMFGTKINLLYEEEINEAEYFDVYPNPSNGIIHIRSSILNVNYILTNLKGKILLSGNLNESIDISHFNNGVYILLLKNRENFVIRKIILSK